VVGVICTIGQDIDTRENPLQTSSNKGASGNNLAFLEDSHQTFVRLPPRIAERLQRLLSNGIGCSCGCFLRSRQRSFLEVVFRSLTHGGSVSERVAVHPNLGWFAPISAKLLLELLRLLRVGLIDCAVLLPSHPDVLRGSGGIRLNGR
jgi:hypothetical protein